MASLKERVAKDGTISYLITVSLGYDQHGKKLTQTTTYKPKAKAPTKAKKEAEAFAVGYEERVMNGDIVSGDRITFADFVDIWAKNWLPAKTPYTRENYPNMLRLHVLPYIGKMKLTTIRATHIDEIITDLKNTGKAPKTVRMVFTVTNSVFRYAMKKQYIRENPCIRCDDLPPVKMKTGKDIQFFTEAQTNVFLREALTREYVITYSGHKRTLQATGEDYNVPDYTEKRSIPLQWRLYFMIAIYGGFRRGEMVALTWKDIDFDRHMISITKAIASVKEGQIVKSPKTEAGIREIVLPSECFDLLGSLKKEQAIRSLKMGTAWQGHRNSQEDDFDDNTIFTQTDGRPVDISTPSHKFGEIIDMWNKSCDRDEDKLPKIRLHDLRHTSATLLLSKNMDIETVAHRLGHSKASVTLDIYGHALPEADQRASDIFEAMFV